MNYRKVILFSVLLLSSAILLADTILLKNGGKIKTSQWWYEGNELRYYGYGGIYGISARDVSLIINDNAQQAEKGNGQRIDKAGQSDQDSNREDFQELEAQAAQLEIMIRNAPAEEKEKTRLTIAELYTKIGNELFVRKSYENALAYYMKALDVRPDFLPAKINIASTYLASGNHRDPLPYILEALEEAPNDPTLHEILGEIYYMMDNVEEAIEEWERSLKLEKNENLRKKVERIRKELSISGNYQISSASHFTLIFDGEKYSNTGDEILSFLGENFDELVYRFSHYPEAPISVIIYPESDFYAVTESPKWVGGLFDGKIRIPVGGLKSLTPRAKRMLLHELAHAFIYSKTKGNCPKWLHEGIAQIIEGKTAPPNLLTGQELERADFSSLDEELDYRVSLSLVSYIEQTYSFHIILLILEELGKGKDIRTALEKCTGLPAEDFIREWKQSMIARSVS